MAMSFALALLLAATLFWLGWRLVTQDRRVAAQRIAVRFGGLLGVLDLASGQYNRLYTRDFDTDHNVMWGLDWSAYDRHLLVIARDYRNGKCELWVFPAAGGPKVRKPLPAEMLGLRVSPEGKVATLRGEKRGQVWVLENFLPAAPETRF